MKKMLIGIGGLLLLMVFMMACNDSKKLGSTPATPDQLEGSWELDYISGPRIAFDGLYPDKKPQMKITVADKRVTGNTSCNNFSGQFTINGATIGFGEPMATTRMACAGEGEQVFLNTLKKVNAYSITEGQTLNLMTGDVAMMRFRRK